MLFAVTGPLPLVYVINKYDLLEESEFSKGELEKIVEDNPKLFFLTSAKTGLNVEAFFHRMAQILAEAVLKEKIKDYDPETHKVYQTKPVPPLDIPPPPKSETKLTLKPEKGTCTECKKEHLLFFEDGRGECPDCGHAFYWDKSKEQPPPED
jgi:50S ribosomal subunit-associated GTPase HflX